MRKRAKHFHEIQMPLQMQINCQNISHVGGIVFVFRWYSKMFFQKYLKDFPGSQATFTVILLSSSASSSSSFSSLARTYYF